MRDQAILHESGKKRNGNGRNGNNRNGNSKKSSIFGAFFAKVSFILFLCVLSVVLIIVGIIAGTWFGGLYFQGPVDPHIALASPVEGRVVFSGGVNYRGTDRVNPARAMPILEGIQEEIRILHWWIVEVESEDILYVGEDDGLENALAVLREGRVNGEYTLYFRLEEIQSGITHLLGGNFYIKDIEAT